MSEHITCTHAIIFESTAIFQQTYIQLLGEMFNYIISIPGEYVQVYSIWYLLIEKKTYLNLYEKYLHRYETSYATVYVMWMIRQIFQHYLKVSREHLRSFFIWKICLLIKHIHRKHSWSVSEVRLIFFANFLLGRIVSKNC